MLGLVYTTCEARVGDVSCESSSPAAHSPALLMDPLNSQVVLDLQSRPAA